MTKKFTGLDESVKISTGNSEHVPWGVAVIKEQPVFCGYIGTTQCCGSAEIWGGGWSNYYIHEVLKHSKAAILFVHWTYSLWSTDLSEKEYIDNIVKSANVAKVFSIEWEKVDGGYMMFLTVEDVAAYYNWVNS